MTRRRWVWLGGLGIAAAACAAPVASGADPARSASAVRVTVRPATGTKRTHFVVGFTSQGSGTSGSTDRQYEVFADGHGARGCTSTAAAPVPATASGQHVRVTLVPRGSSHVWCAGRYSGRLEETIRPVCGYREVCPQFIAIMTVGTFRFRVS